MPETLLACPFCGTVPEAPDAPTGLFNNHYWHVTCWNNACPALHCETKGHPTEEAAVAAWNTRGPVSAHLIR